MNNHSNRNHREYYRIFGFTLMAILPGLFACGDDVGLGTLRLTTYGEDYIEKQIPAAAGSAEGLVDGYTLTFDRFLVLFSDLKVGTRDNPGSALPIGPFVFDVHKAGPHLIYEHTGIPAERYDRMGVTLGPNASATAGNATASDVTLMKNGGYSVFVSGKAKKGTDIITFQWGFSTKTVYSQCKEASGGEGVVVPRNGSVTAQFTVHGDHLFYDDLQSEDPSLRFEAMAKADADKNGEVTLEELAKVDLTTLPSGQYGTGGSGTVKNLRQFVEALSRTLIHFQGEGHCHSGS